MAHTILGHRRCGGSSAPTSSCEDGKDTARLSPGQAHLCREYFLPHLRRSANDRRHEFVHGDIGDAGCRSRIAGTAINPRAIVHLAPRATWIALSAGGTGMILSLQRGRNFALLRRSTGGAYWAGWGLSGESAVHYFPSLCGMSLPTTKFFMDRWGRTSSIFFSS